MARQPTLSQIEQISHAALGKAVLQIIRDTPDYPADPVAYNAVSVEINFAVELMARLAERLDQSKRDDEWALQTLMENEFRFEKPGLPVDLRDHGPHDDDLPF